MSDNFSKLHSICSRSRLEGTLLSEENPNLLSFSGFNEFTSHLCKIRQAGLSKLRFDVKKITFRKDDLFITLFFFLSFPDFMLKHLGFLVKNHGFFVEVLFQYLPLPFKGQFQEKIFEILYVATFLQIQQQLSDSHWKMFSRVVNTAISSLEEQIVGKMFLEWNGICCNSSNCKVENSWFQEKFWRG